MLVSAHQALWGSSVNFLPEEVSLARRQSSFLPDRLYFHLLPPAPSIPLVSGRGQGPIFGIFDYFFSKITVYFHSEGQRHRDWGQLYN